MSATKIRADEAKQRAEDHIKAARRVLDNTKPMTEAALMVAANNMDHAMKAWKEYKMLQNRYNSMRQSSLFEQRTMLGALNDLLMD